MSQRNALAIPAVAALALMTLKISTSHAAEYAFRFEWQGNVQYMVNQHTTWITVGWTDEGRCRRGCTTTPIQPGEYRAFPRYRGQVSTVSCIQSHVVRANGRWACRR